MRKFFAMEARHELPKGTAREWAHHTPSLKSLPEHAGNSKEKKGKESRGDQGSKKSAEARKAAALQGLAAYLHSLVAQAPPGIKLAAGYRLGRLCEAVGRLGGLWPGLASVYPEKSASERLALATGLLRGMLASQQSRVSTKESAASCGGSMRKSKKKPGSRGYKRAGWLERLHAAKQGNALMGYNQAGQSQGGMGAMPMPSGVGLAPSSTSLQPMGVGAGAGSPGNGTGAPLGVGG